MEEERPNALEMAKKTLTAMRLGGIWDHVGFGFHRYSTDARWLLPHFEKMLYDQALIATAYLEAYQITKEWSIHLPGKFSRRIEDESLVLWRPGFTIWIDVWGNDSSESNSERLDRIKDEASKDKYDEEFINNNYIILATKKGIIKKTTLEAYSRPRQNGIIAINKGAIYISLICSHRQPFNEIFII